MEDTYALSIRDEIIGLSDPMGGYVVIRGSVNLKVPGVIEFDLAIVGDTSQARVDRENDLTQLFDWILEAEEQGFTATFNLNRGVDRTVFFDLTGWPPDQASPLTPTDLYPGLMNVQTFHVKLFASKAARAVPYDVAVESGLTGSEMMIDIDQVPGTADAWMQAKITDTSTGGAITRFRIAKAPRGISLVDDSPFHPWTAPTAIGSATDQAGGMVGTTYAQLVTTSKTMLGLAEFEMPDGHWHQGRQDVYALISGTGGVIGTPSAPTGAITEAISSGKTPAVTEASTPATRGNQANDDRNTSGDLVVSITGHADSNYIVMARVSGYNGSNSNPVVCTASIVVTGEISPNVVQIVEERNAGNPHGQGIFGWLVRSHTGTFTATITIGGASPTAGQAAVFEVRNAKTDTVVEDVSAVVNETSPQLSVTTGTTADNIVILMGAVDQDANAGGALTGTFNGYTGNWDKFTYGAWQQADGSSQSFSTKILKAGGTWSGFMVSLSVDVTTVSPETDSGFIGPTPGVLEVGAYTPRIQAIDSAGYYGNAVAGSTVTTDVPNSSIRWTWPAVTNADLYAISIQAVVNGRTLIYFDLTENPNYTLSDVSSLSTIAALPATSGAVAPPPLVEARIGTAGDTLLKEIKAVTMPGAGTYRFVKLCSNEFLPPCKPLLDGTYPDWLMQVYCRSANGTSTTFRLHGLWTVPTREPQCEVHAVDDLIASNARWMIEAHRMGQGVVVQLQNPATGVDVGRGRGSGTPLLSPGDNSISIVPMKANGVVDLPNSHINVQLTIVPRYLWEAGTW